MTPVLRWWEKPQSYPAHWAVIGVLESGHSVGRYGHQHATVGEATLCPWTPDPWPEVCDLLVRQFRTWPEGTHKTRAKPGKAARARQLELGL